MALTSLCRARMLANYRQLTELLSGTHAITGPQDLVK
jgi:hypothetical protein